MPQGKWVYFNGLITHFCVLRQSGTIVNEYGSIRIASLHISCVFRLSGVSLIHTGVISSRDIFINALGLGEVTIYPKAVIFVSDNLKQLSDIIFHQHFTVIYSRLTLTLRVPEINVFQ